MLDLVQEDDYAFPSPIFLQEADDGRPRVDASALAAAHKNPVRHGNGECRHALVISEGTGEEGFSRSTWTNKEGVCPQRETWKGFS